MQFSRFPLIMLRVSESKRKLVFNLPSGSNFANGIISVKEIAGEKTFSNAYREYAMQFSRFLFAKLIKKIK